MAQVTTPLGYANNTRNFYPADDKWEVKYFPTKASVAGVEGCAVAYEVSGSSPTGYITVAAATDANGQNVVGILAETIAATDSDYATAGKLKAVYIPKTLQAEAYFVVGAGTFTAADVGRVCNIHTDSKSLAVDTNGLGAEITGYITSTTGKCKFSLPKVVTS